MKIFGGALLWVCGALGGLLQLPLINVRGPFADSRPNDGFVQEEDAGSVRAQSATFKTPTRMAIQEISNSIPIKGWEHLLYLTTISIGTPPQNFTAAIDITWRDLFIPSSKCKGDVCRKLWSTYNSSESSTFVINGTEVSLHYAGLYTSGFVSDDVVHLGNLTIQDQQFEEAIELRPAPGYWGNIFDGVLGLAPPSANAARHPLHPLSTMVSQRVLDKNIFGLRLPSDGLTEGELTIGGTNPNSYLGDLVTIPTTSETDPYLRDKWTVKARSAWLGDGDNVKADLSGYVAFFDSGYPFISLPRDLTMDILRRLDAKPGNGLLLTVPCQKRQVLPELTFGFHDANISLTAFDYTNEEDGECAVMIDAHQENRNEQPYLRLGTSFLKGLYSVFDVDEKAIRFARVKHPATPGRTNSSET